MNILFVSAVLPYPLYSGGQIRVYNLIKTLSKKHEITLFSFIRDEKEKQYVKELSFCKRVETVYRGRAWQPSYIFKSMFGTYPFLLSTYDNNEMRGKLEDALKNETFDLMHIEPGYVWPSVPKSTVPLVVSEHNIEHTVYEEYVKRFPFVPLRPFLYADVLKLMYWEKQIWKRANKVIAVSDDDKTVMRRSVDASKISVVPNGVDVSVYPFQLKELGKAPVFLFVGNFLWMQNRDAVNYLATHVWPQIKNMYLTATLRIVGKHMPDSLRKKMGDGMVVLEHVEDIMSEYKKADIVLAPIRVGGGTQFKILEAMAVGIPVITTSKGAEGLRVTNRKELFIADDVEAVISAVNFLLTDEKKGTAIIRSARRCIETYYSWDTIAKELDVVWRSATSS